MITIKKSILGTCIGAMLVTGCAAPGGLSGSTTAGDTAARCASFGVGGALLGVVVGGRHAAVKGALVGLAACAMVEIASRQTKSSEVVDQQYRSNHRNQLPQTARIDDYITTVSPNGVARAGDAIRVQSTIRVVSGVREPVTEVREQLIVYAPNGEEFKRGEKKLNDAGGSGEFENAFTLRLPEGAPQGVYTFNTQLFLNGKSAMVRDRSVQVAAVEAPANLALATY